MSKFNPNRFKSLILKKIQDNGYSIRGFVDAHKFPRSPLMKAMKGESIPSRDTLNSWCNALECTSQERKEIFHSVGLLALDEIEEESAA